MNQRFDYGQIGFVWVLRTMGWVALIGALCLAAPAAIVFGRTAAMWALGATAVVTLAYAWIGAEAVSAWRGPAREEADSVPLPSES
jgi:hypothetical protein